MPAAAAALTAVQSAMPANVPENVCGANTRGTPESFLALAASRDGRCAACQQSGQSQGFVAWAKTPGAVARAAHEPGHG
jgi:hypothetical protein